MFEVVDHGHIWGAYVVRGLDGFTEQVAIFLGPEARARAEAYVRWLNAGAAFQRRRTDPGYKGRTDPERSGHGARTPAAARTARCTPWRRAPRSAIRCRACGRDTGNGRINTTRDQSSAAL